MERFSRRGDKSKCNVHNPLTVNTNFDFDIKRLMECNCNVNGTKIKSGKYVKSSVNIQKQEIWPHNAVSKKYTKRPTFDNIEFEQFVAGETKIIYNLLCDMNMLGEARGRLRVLTLISHWQCRVKTWPVIRSLYESIIEEVETGERTWEDDFSGYETMLPAITPTVSAVASMNSVNDKNRKSGEVFWCKNFQNGSCEQNSPHLGQVKVDEPAVSVLHICAFCWSMYKKKKEHAEVECMAKKSASQ